MEYLIIAAHNVRLNLLCLSNTSVLHTRVLYTQPLLLLVKYMTEIAVIFTASARTVSTDQNSCWAFNEGRA